MANQAEILGAALRTATINANLALLPTFSDNLEADKYTAKEWLQQVLNNKQGGAWTDDNTITYFRNALRGPMVTWYESLTIIDATQLTWDRLRRTFERDYRAAPTTSTVISRLTEIKQKDGESVNSYFARCAQILGELKTRLMALADEDPPLTLIVTPAVAAAFAELDEPIQQAHNFALKRATAAYRFNQIAGFHMMAGFKATIRASLLDKEADLTTLDEIKIEALRIEQKEMERKKHTSEFKEQTKPTPTPGVHSINENYVPTSQEEVDAINLQWKTKIGKQNQNRNKNHPQGGNQQPTTRTCTHCNKQGHTEDKCYSKHGYPGRNNPPDNGNKQSKDNKLQKNCTFCNMANHKVDKCFKLLKAEKILKANKGNQSNPVHEISEQEETKKSKN
jgi:Retrotransposon gag protein